MATKRVLVCMLMIAVARVWPEFIVVKPEGAEYPSGGPGVLKGSRTPPRNAQEPPQPGFF